MEMPVALTTAAVLLSSSRLPYIPLQPTPKVGTRLDSWKVDREARKLRLSLTVFVRERGPSQNAYLICDRNWTILGREKNSSLHFWFTGVTEKLALQWLPCQAPGVTGSALGPVGPVSVYCDWVRQNVGSATSISVWQHVKLSEQIRP